MIHARTAICLTRIEENDNGKQLVTNYYQKKKQNMLRLAPTSVRIKFQYDLMIPIEICTIQVNCLDHTFRKQVFCLIMKGTLQRKE